MENSRKVISFECENEKTYYVVQAPNLMFGEIKEEAVIFDSYEDLITALSGFKYIPFPHPKMVINDL